MPHKTEPSYRFISIIPLSPTIGAEVSGVNFSEAVPSEVFAEIKDAIGKVSEPLLQHSTASHQDLPYIHNSFPVDGPEIR